MPTYFTDEHGVRYEVRRDEEGREYLEPLEDAGSAPAAPPRREKPANSWADVYRVSDCGGCRRADCPRCQARFLSYLRENGTKTGSR